MSEKKPKDCFNMQDFFPSKGKVVMPCGKTALSDLTSAHLLGCKDCKIANLEQELNWAQGDYERHIAALAEQRDSTIQRLTARVAELEAQFDEHQGLRRLDQALMRDQKNIIDSLRSKLLVAERFAESQRILKETNIQRWTDAQQRLAHIENILCAATGEHCGIHDNLATLTAERDRLKAENAKLRAFAQYSVNTLIVTNPKAVEFELLVRDPKSTAARPIYHHTPLLTGEPE